MDDAQNPYDAVPYQGGTFPQTHPQYLAALGTLFGMNPPKVELARVLELGCAEGGNLIPMAAQLPDGRFMGIDYSATQIQFGRETIQAAGLSNIELRFADIRELDESLGMFDYIIAHGVYSWVPDDVRKSMLELCGRHLAANGIAIVSYNTNPAGHFRRMIREMMLYHTRRQSDPLARAAESRRLLDFLIESAPEHATAYREVLEWERRHVRECRDHQLHHDLLEAVNDPIAIAEFMDRAEEAGLQYLGDADFSSMLPGNLGPQVEERLSGFARSRVEMEQYMDFVRNRSFRQTLLCQDCVTLNTAIDPLVIRKLFVAGRIVPIDTTRPLFDRSESRFRGVDGSEIKTNSPIAKAAFAVLAESWAGNLAFDELFSRARAKLIAAGNSEMELPSRNILDLCQSLMTCFSNRLVELSVRKYSCAGEIPARPTAERLARLQAERGSVVTNLRHETVQLQPPQRSLLRELNGSHTLESLLSPAAGKNHNRLDPPSPIPRLHFEMNSNAESLRTTLTELVSLGLLLR